MKTINLDATTSSIELKLWWTVATNQVQWTSHWYDRNTATGAIIEWKTTGLSNNATAVTIVAAPASWHTITLKEVSVYNDDTTSATVIIQFNDNSNVRVMSKKILASWSSCALSDWSVTSTGDVVWPGSATDNNIAVFDGGTGKLIKDSTKKISDYTPSTRNLTINGTTYDLSADRSWTVSGGGWFWTAVPWTPTRTGNNTFTLTDTGNTNKYDLLLQRCTILKWTESSVVKQAMIVSATYATNTVTVTIMWDTMASIDSSSLKYGAVKARVWKFALAGTIGATGTNVMNTVMAECPAKPFGIDLWAWTAWNWTTTIDCNKWGTTMFTTKPSITTTEQSSLWNSVDSGTTIATWDMITIDQDAVAATTKIIDEYVNLYYTPLYNYYLS